MVMYRWRCKMDLLMIDDNEFAVIKELYSQGCDIPQLKELHGNAPNELTLEDRFGPMLDAYESLTGMRETNPFAIMHHEISRHGPPCLYCGKPLKTDRASYGAYRRACRK